MTKQREGGQKIPTLTKNDLTKRISDNTAQYNKSMRRIRSDMRSKNLKRGRVRPRDPDEAEVLFRFKRTQSHDESYIYLKLSF